MEPDTFEAPKVDAEIRKDVHAVLDATKELTKTIDAEIRKDVHAVLDATKELTKTIGDLMKEMEKLRKAGRFCSPCTVPLST